MKIIFFGSTSDSVLVLEKLNLFNIIAVVTPPAKPVGRKQIITPTPVESWAKNKNISVLSFPSLPNRPWLFADESLVNHTLAGLKPDLLITACFGQKIPSEIISRAKFGGLNIHPSLLPRWRGADPVPWAILTGDRQTGVTISTITDKFDQGQIIAQQIIPISDQDFTDPLRTKLFKLGAELLVNLIQGSTLKMAREGLKPNLKSSYARRLNRQDGFEPWEAIQKAINSGENAQCLDQKYRAFYPWPGLWTTLNNKRLKIIKCHRKIDKLVLDEIQLEGKNPVNYQQFAARSSLIPTSAVEK